jgi:YHS domain-containing protein
MRQANGAQQSPHRHCVTYFLCCPKCQADFESTPNLYANPEMGQKIKKNKRRH